MKNKSIQNNTINLFRRLSNSIRKNRLSQYLGIIGSLASILGLIFYFQTTEIQETHLLTIFVTDIHDNVVLEHKGEINISIGNRPLRETIGEHGRTNFGDISSVNLGDSINIGFKAEGWKLVNDNNNYIFNGKPIKIKIKKDSSLGVVKGVVKSRDGQIFIEGAKVLVNSDTIVKTDANGIFKIFLPDSLQIEKPTDSYLLTVSKKGYVTKTQFHNPKSSDAEIRLMKQR